MSVNFELFISQYEAFNGHSPLRTNESDPIMFEGQSYVSVDVQNYNVSLYNSILNERSEMQSSPYSYGEGRAIGPHYARLSSPFVKMGGGRKLAFHLHASSFGDKYSLLDLNDRTVTHPRKEDLDNNDALLWSPRVPDPGELDTLTGSFIPAENEGEGDKIAFANMTLPWKKDQYLSFVDALYRDVTDMGLFPYYGGEQTVINQVNLDLIWRDGNSRAVLFLTILYKGKQAVVPANWVSLNS